MCWLTFRALALCQSQKEPKKCSDEGLTSKRQPIHTLYGVQHITPGISRTASAAHLEKRGRVLFIKSWIKDILDAISFGKAINFFFKRLTQPNISNVRN